MIQAVFFDVDGTLLSHTSNQVPHSTRYALRTLRERGIRIFMATGRHVQELAELTALKGLTFDALLTLNGGYCFCDDGLIYANPINRQDIDKLMKTLQETPFPCLFLEADRMYMNYHDANVIKMQSEIHTSLPPLGDISRAYSHDIYQVVPYIDQAQEKALLKEMKHARAVRWGDNVIDLIPDNGGKDQGILAIMAYYHLRQEETMSFGDGENDIAMFHMTGTSIALGNSPSFVQCEADEVCEDVDHDGIYKSLVRHHLLEDTLCLL